MFVCIGGQPTMPAMLGQWPPLGLWPKAGNSILSALLSGKEGKLCLQSAPWFWQLPIVYWASQLLEIQSSAVSPPWFLALSESCSPGTWQSTPWPWSGKCGFGNQNRLAWWHATCLWPGWPKWQLPFCWMGFDDLRRLRRLWKPSAVR